VKHYTARPGTTFNNRDAKIIGAFLDRRFPDGVYTPKEIVDAARPGNSPIHKYFEWDDSRAAELYRLQQARKLIQCLFVEVNGVRDVPKSVSVYVGTSKTRTYVDTSIAYKDKDLWSQVLEEAIQGLRSWKLRYERFEQVKELRPVFKAIQEVQKRYERKKAGKQKGRVKNNRYSANQQKVGKNNHSRGHSSSR